MHYFGGDELTENREEEAYFEDGDFPVEGDGVDFPEEDEDIPNQCELLDMLSKNKELHRLQLH